ncbi:hypothetical protein SAMN05216345_107257 [Cupriavidus sp. YR651]|uniref:response regulator transcription factor n=1 Tax=Cupriavidus sp. YR651 TaxID=1855315 RepID=UPI00087F0B4F|nr:response regulator transcription factor [Cupriavidus sp. YR651]SDD27920.1 hypothetical protein SAMN05216345_107257 [Cupriavidus sp. YR651]
MTAIVIEAQPLARLGMQRMLARMPGIGAVQSIEPSDIPMLAASRDDVLVVFGMSGDAADNWCLLRRLHQALPNARILLLSDGVLPRVPSSLQPFGVMEHLPKAAPIETMEAVIFHMLDDDPSAHLAVSGSDVRQPPRHQ